MNPLIVLGVACILNSACLVVLMHKRAERTELLRLTAKRVMYQAGQIERLQKELINLRFEVLG